MYSVLRNYVILLLGLLLMFALIAPQTQAQCERGVYSGEWQDENKQVSVTLNVEGSLETSLKLTSLKVDSVGYCNLDINDLIVVTPYPDLGGGIIGNDKVSFSVVLCKPEVDLEGKPIKVIYGNLVYKSCQTEILVRLIQQPSSTGGGGDDGDGDGDNGDGGTPGGGSGGTGGTGGDDNNNGEDGDDSGNDYVELDAVKPEARIIGLSVELDPPVVKLNQNVVQENRPKYICFNTRILFSNDNIPEDFIDDAANRIMIVPLSSEHIASREQAEKELNRYGLFPVDRHNNDLSKLIKNRLGDRLSVDDYDKPMIEIPKFYSYELSRKTLLQREIPLRVKYLDKNDSELWKADVILVVELDQSSAPSAAPSGPPERKVPFRRILE